jgi:integrase
MTKEELRGLGRVFRRTRRDPKSKNPKDRIQSKLWWVQYYHRGKQIRKPTGETKKSKAMQFLKNELERSVSGRLVVGQGERLDFKAMSERLLSDYRRNRRRSIDRAEDGIGHLDAYFGGWRASEIDSGMIEQFVNYRIEDDGAANATVSYELAILKRMFRLCRSILGTPPEFPKIEVSNSRQGFFEEAEFRAVCEHLDDDIRPAVTFAYLTGWRVKSEVLALTWPHVDFNAGEVRLESGTTKNDEGRVFPFSMFPELEALLRSQRERTNALQQESGAIIPWVFHRRGSQIKTIRGSWSSAVKNAKIGKKILHDFRRTAVRNLERAGVPRAVGMQLVGHKTESMYHRYTIVPRKDLEDGIKRLAEFRILQTKEPAKIVVMKTGNGEGQK